MLPSCNSRVREPSHYQDAYRDHSPFVLDLQSHYGQHRSMATKGYFDGQRIILTEGLQEGHASTSIGRWIRRIDYSFGPEILVSLWISIQRRPLFVSSH
jgi:hypothetical protein